MNKKFSDNFMQELTLLIKQKSVDNEDSSYTSSLLRGSLNKVAQKVGEEATEVVIAALAESKESLISETCDLLFHLLVLLEAKDVSLSDLRDELTNRNHEDLDKIKKS
ncbi:MAG: phosphoribosyl-ATP diphosphatase [Rickettsiales bacterium]|jgi:phosphoribosyl-AMP cyclohydrolase / phosphoribosyl-ATP pyrophosphohydrolase|nr:phosphoribosyl-ATP diphosphatase [Rickettsiales bacterium]